MSFRSSPWRVLAWACAAALCGSAAAARAQFLPRDNPYTYGLRLTVFPVSFQAGVNQSAFGSGARAEVDLGRRFMFAAAGRLAWAGVAGQTDPLGYDVRAGIAWNFIDEIETELLAGTVHPADTPALGDRAGIEFRGGAANDRAAVSERLGSPRNEPPDRDLETRAPIRIVQSLRLGYDLVRAVEYSASYRGYFDNRLHAFYLGYSHGAHWSLSPATAGEREVGWRRYYFDVMVTAKPLIEAEPLGPARTPMPRTPDPFIGGVRIGMEGAIGALIPRVHGFGFGYDLELGLLPGVTGFEGYLFIGLGVALDLVIR